MTIGLGGLLLFVLAPLLLGAAGLSALGLRLGDDRLGWLGLCHAAGALLVALLLEVGTGCGLPLTLGAALGLFGGATLLLALLALVRLRVAEPRAQPATGPDGTPAGRLLFGLAVALALGLTLDRALVAAASPIHFGDETTIWNAKAKSLWFAGGINDRLPELVDHVLNVHQADYPMLLPWNMVWVDLCAGAATDVEARWPAQLALVALLLVAAGAIRRRAPPALAALLVLALASGRAAELLTASAFADGFVSLGVLVLADGWMRYEESGQRRFARLALVGAALTAGAKNEGLIVLLAFASALAVAAALDRRGALRGRLRALGASAALLLLPAAVLLLQQLDKARFGWTNDLTGSSTGFLANASERLSLESLATIARFYAATSLSTINRAEVPAWADRSDQNLLPAALAAMLLLSIRARWPAAPGRRVVLLTFGFWFLALVPVYLASHVGVEWHLVHSTERVCFQAVPAATLLLAPLLAQGLARRPVRPAAAAPARARTAAAPASPGGPAG